MKTAICYPFLLWMSLLPAARAAAADELIYFAATVDNTTLADGTALKVVTGKPAAAAEITRGTADAEPNNHWHWREGAGSGSGDKRGVLSAAGARDNDTPMLRTVVSGLKPESDYQVFGFYWVAGFATDDTEPAGDNQWDIRLGCGKAKMMGYGHRDNAGLPGTIGRRANGEGAIRQMDAPLYPATGELLDRDGDRRLFRAPLGCERTDAKGTLVVYVDDQAGDSNEGRTWYDGIGVMPATTKADVGSAAPGALHLAVRCGDWEMVRRELAAGADLNTVDHDGLTPLFYLAAALDAERVKAFLQAGAKPDVEGQKYTPLCASALAGDVEITKMLLAAGAKIANLVVPTKSESTFLANPVEAAIRSGSVAVLKLLLAQNPKLDLERTVYGPDFDSKDPNIFDRHDQGLVRMSLKTNWPEMAAFLIDRGCMIVFAEDYNVPTGRVDVKMPGRGMSRGINSGSHTLMLKAVMNHPPMLEVIAALTKRGEPVIVDSKVDYDAVVVPWDALSGAVWEGQTALVNQWLPQAAEVNEEYQLRLTVLAESCGNPDVLEMVRKQFPKAKWTPFQNPDDPVEVARARTSGPKGLFKPRTLAPETRRPSNDTKVLAVISSPEASGPAAALAAKASEQASWSVVEREEINKLLDEKSRDKPTAVGSAELSAIGDRLAADLFIMVSRFGQGDKALLSFEAANVRTGLLFDRLIIAANEFKPDTFSADYLARVRKKLDSQSGAGALTGITMLDISADPKVPQGRTLANLLHAGLLQEIDAIPGMIALTREQMEPLATEKILNQSGALWGAAWTLEGGLSQGDGDQVEFAVRLRSLGSKPISHDVKVTDAPDHPQIMVREAWRKIADLLDKSVAVDKDTDPEQRATTEAARLMREAEWLANCQKPWEAIPVIDAALYLGAEPLKALPLRMRIHWDSRHFWNPREQFGTVYRRSDAWGYPLRPEYHDYARRWVSEHLELLRITSETLDRVQQILKEHPDEIRNDTYEDFWRYWDCLITYRSQLVPTRLSAEQLAALKDFDAELETLFKRLLSLVKSPGEWGKRFWRNEYITQHFRVLPCLGRMIAGEIVRTWPAEDADYVPPLFGDIDDASFDPPRADLICGLLEQAMSGKDLRFRALRQAELGLLRATGDERRAAARTLAHARIDALAASLVPPSRWVSNDQSRTLLPLMTSYFSRPKVPPDGFLTSLVASPQQVPDMWFRLETYTVARRILARACDKNSPKWQQHVAGYMSLFNSDLNALVARNAPGEAFDRLREGASLLDATYQTDYVSQLQPKLDQLRPKSAGEVFGSKGQFPILNFEGMMDTKLLADIRSGVTDQPAMITHTMVDPRNRHLLWLILQPYQDWDFKLQEPWTSGTARFVARQPWLLAIDCRDGHTVHKINLATIPGLWSQSPPETMTITNFNDAIARGMIANDTHLLLQVRWGRVPDAPGQPYPPDITSLVSINRATAEVQVMPQKMRIDDCAMLDTYGNRCPAATGVGDSFYVIQSIKPEGNMPEGNKPEGNMLWQIQPGKEPKALTKSGRRPEQSPFDAEDRRIGLLHPDEGRLLALSSWDHLAYYNPALARWEDAPARSADEWRDYAQGIERNLFQSTLFPHHRFQLDDGMEGAFEGPSTTVTGRLPFQYSDLRKGHLPVRMRVPETYRARFQVDHEVGLGQRQPAEYEWIHVADLARSNMVTPAVLNQTDDFFVLGTRLASGGQHYTGKSRPYLPFLWILNKKEAAAAMKRVQAK